MSKTPKIIPISDLRQDASNAVKGVSASKEPVFITQRGRVTAVMASMQADEASQQGFEILRLLARGEKEMKAGVGYKYKVLRETDRFLEVAIS